MLLLSKGTVYIHPLLLSLGSLVINRMQRSDTAWQLRLGQKGWCSIPIVAGMPVHRAWSYHVKTPSTGRFSCWGSHVWAFSWQLRWGPNRRCHRLLSGEGAILETQPSQPFRCLQPWPTSHCDHMRDPKQELLSWALSEFLTTKESGTKHSRLLVKWYPGGWEVSDKWK